MAQDNKGINPLATGVAGAIIGAAAAAAAIALSDEKNRKKAEKILSEMEKEGDKVLKQITGLARQLQEKGKKAISSAKSNRTKPQAKKAVAKRS